MGEKYKSFRGLVIILRVLFKFEQKQAVAKIHELIRDRQIQPTFRFKGYVVYVPRKSTETPYQSYYQCNYIDGYLTNQSLTDFWVRSTPIENHECYESEIYELTASSFIEMKYQPIELQAIKPIVLMKGTRVMISADKPLSSNNQMAFLNTNYTVSYSETLFPVDMLYKAMGGARTLSDNDLKEWSFVNNENHFNMPIQPKQNANTQAEIERLIDQISTITPELDKANATIAELKKQLADKQTHEPSSEGQGDSLLVLGAVMNCIPSIAKNNYTQQALIDDILTTYPNTTGISESTLKKKFTESKKHLNQRVN